MIGHDPYGADKNALAQIDAEIARLEIEEAELNLDFKRLFIIEEELEKHVEEFSDNEECYEESSSGRPFYAGGLLEFFFHLFGLEHLFYFKRQADVSSRKKILLKLRDSLRSKISRAFVVPNIRSKLQKILKPLFRRCVGEEPIKFFTYDSKLINLIEHKNDRENTIYRNYRLAS